MREYLATLEGQRIHVKALYQSIGIFGKARGKRRMRAVKTMCFRWVKRDGHHIAQHVWVEVSDAIAQKAPRPLTWVEFDARVVRYLKPRETQGTWHDFTLADVEGLRPAHDD